ncbi:MAG: hypothetical protein ACOX27_00255 [Caldicoprobacterales bacterium]|jgi:hypothetical protein|nr:hypothetical protein [Clostridiales bacterium]
MFIDTYIAIPLWILSIFGFFCLVLRVYSALDIFRRKKQGTYTLIISARNQEDAVEGVVRSFVLGAGLDSAEEKLLQIVLLDMGSDDDTPKIMENLSRDYSIVRLIEPDDLAVCLKNLV